MQRVLLAATLMALWPALAVGQVPPTLAPVPPLPRIGLPLPEISGSEKPVAGRTDAQKPPSRKEAHRLPAREASAPRTSFVRGVLPCVCAVSLGWSDGSSAGPIYTGTRVDDH
jgi:hypothetical protein